MSTVTPTMTTKEMLALPEDGMERELIRGELRERETTRRNRLHAATESRIVRTLGNWLVQQTDFEADVLSGEAGSILQQDPDTTVGIDVALFSLDVLRRQTDETRMVLGVPILAVEILSPNDKHEEIREKIVEYLRTGVRLVWEVDPDFQTVRVYRQDHEPVMFNRQQTLSAADVLPGFEVAVADLFPNWPAEQS
ncbi:MAG: Uma2 family endonuclease [Planctomycetota bacterium]|nr:Uma2 family endonuclease [Planctomycetota bacterium]